MPKLNGTIPSLFAFAIVATLAALGPAYAVPSEQSTKPTRDYLETKVQIDKLTRAQMMSLGSTLPGKLYRVSEGSECVVSLASVTKTRPSRGWFSTTTSTETMLSRDESLARKKISDQILGLKNHSSRDVMGAMDQFENVDLKALSTSGDREIANLAKSAIGLLDALCSDEGEVSAITIETKEN